jgi:hypothetical protein
VKGCEVSTGGTLVAYWSDRKISLFNSDDLAVPSKYKNIDRAFASLGDNDNCIWNSLALTEELLVVSKTGITFQVCKISVHMLTKVKIDWNSAICMTFKVRRTTHRN